MSMPDRVTLPGRTFILGDHKLVGVKNVRSESGAAMTSTTATITIWDSSGVATLAETSMTVAISSDTFRAKASYTVLTGSGQTITTAGTYRAVYKLTMPDSSIWQWEQVLEVKTNPF